MKCIFIVGQKVVCRGNEWSRMMGSLPDPCPLPVGGQIYTVTFIEPYGEEVFLELKEMPPHVGYDHRGFRPLQERPREANTDISLFRPLLNVKECEDA